MIYESREVGVNIFFSTHKLVIFLVDEDIKNLQLWVGSIQTPRMMPFQGISDTYFKSIFNLNVKINISTWKDTELHSQEWTMFYLCSQLPQKKT